MKLKTSGLPRGLSLRGESYYAFLTHPDGRKERRAIGVVSESFAIRQRQIWMREIQESRYVKKAPKPVADTLLFSEILDDWLEYIRQEGPGGLESTESRVKFIKTWFPGRLASSITSDEIETKLNEAARARKWKGATFNHYRQCFSGTFTRAVDKRKLASNPVNNQVTFKELNNARTDFLSRDEADALRAVIAAQYPEHVPDFDLALYTGLRRSEQYGRCGKYERSEGLEWNHVRLAQHFLKVPKSKHGKMRNVILNADAESALRVLETRKSGTRVFGSYRAKSMKWFDKAVASTGLSEKRDISWHSLRHTWASWLVMAGCDLLTLKTLGGWSSLKMVERYAHLAPDHLVSAVNRISSLKPSVPAKQSDTNSDTRPATALQVHVN